MLVLLFVIMVAVAIFFYVKYVKENEKACVGAKCSNDKAECYCLGSAIAASVAITIVGIGCVLMYGIGTGYTIDNKIAMYEEENAAIEESIDVTVKGYMDFETSTYGDLKDEDAINLVSLFPELKSDTLVQKQIDVYVANNDKIKQLKEEKINLSKNKWLLYFGK